MACGGDGAEPSLRIPAVLQVVSGNNQSAVAGTELANPLVVRVEDAGGQPVAGQAVNFRVTAGGGSVFAGTATSDANGLAADRWTLGTSVSAQQQVEARAVRSDGTPVVFGTFSATVLPGPGAQLMSALGNGQSVGILDTEPESVSVLVADSYGNPVAGAAVTWAVTSGGGSISPAVSTSGAMGRAAALWTLGPRLDSLQTARATLGASARTFDAVPLLPAGATFVKLAGDSQSATAGTVLPETLVVALHTTGNRPVPGARIDWSGTSGGTLTPLATTTDGLGEVRAVWRLGANPGRVFDTAHVRSSSLIGGGPSRTASYTAASLMPPLIGVVAGGLGLDFRDFSCALTQTQAAFCWGNNQRGQLGLQTGTTFNPVARAVSGGIPFSALAAGSAFTCGLRTDGSLWCWGLINNSSTPGRYFASLTFAQLSAGWQHACGLTTGGDAYCVGNNANGQLGTNDSLVLGGHVFVSISAGRHHSCAVDAAGAAWCWGSNTYGQLGTGTPGGTTPAAVQGGLVFASISAGGFHSCGVTTAGAGWCWGYGGHGELGNGGDVSSATPTAVTGGLTFSSTSAGDYHTCGVTTTGQAFCWGRGLEGEMGDGAPIIDTHANPVPVAGGLPSRR